MGFPIRPLIGIPCFGFDPQPLFQGASALLQEGIVVDLSDGHQRKVNENLHISVAKAEFVE
jgi:hypothetical protein